MRTKNFIVAIFLLIVFFTPGCSINVVTQTPDLELTAAVQALAIQQTQSAQMLAQQNNQNQSSPAVVVVTATAEAAPAPVNTNTVAPPPAAQKPEIINSTVCWIGPGNKYEVVSSLSKGQSVEVIGRGDTNGWIIVKNPIYKDPCWMQAFDIKLDPSVDIKSLQIFYPPVPPTKTPLPLPSPTPI